MYKLFVMACGSNVAYRHACIIMDKHGEIVASGCNYKPSYSGTFHTIHAEDAAIRDLKYKGMYGKAHTYTLIVIRIGGCTLLDASGNPKPPNTRKHETFVPTNMKVAFGNSKPCDSCQEKIDAAKFKHVIYSIAQ
jgi:deoxycytidylate deaminase